MKNSKSPLAKKSLSRDKPWDCKKYPNETPPGWEWNSTMERWNDPPDTWRFNRRFEYWFQVRVCKQHLEGKCKKENGCRKFHPPSPQMSKEPTRPANIDDSKTSDSPVNTAPEETSPKENATEKTSSQEVFPEDVAKALPEDAETKCTIDAILNLKGFENVSKPFRKIQSQTELWKHQGRDLKEQCSKMSMIILRREGSDNLEAAKIYHRYLENSGYFSAKPQFSEMPASKDSCLDDSSFDEPFPWSESGAVFIDNAGELSFLGRDRIISHMIANQNLVVILAMESDQLTDLFDNLKTRFSWQIHSPIDKNEVASARVRFALDFILKSIEKDFKGRMKLEGGPQGAIQVLARRVTKQCGLSREKIKDVAHAELNKVYNRQNERLMKYAERDTAEERSERVDELLISTEDILGPIPNIDVLQGGAWKELQSMVGLEAVKLSVKSFLNGLIHDHYRELKGQESLQVGLSRLFLGPPGTGKTTVAKLYGQILAALGLLSCGRLIVKSGSDFIGEFVGQSAVNTKEILQEARGNVLLIDEAYMLDAKRSRNCPHRQEATDVLVKEVENKPGEDLCVIMCGYKDEMENFIRDANPGLRRRFPIDDAFVFEDFNEEQLGAILDIKMKQRHLSATAQGRNTPIELLNLAKQRPNFGNGGEVDNVLSRAISNFRNRFQEIPEDQHSTDIPLTMQDFDPECSRILDAEEEVNRQFKDFIDLEAHIDLFRSFARQAKNAREWNVDPRRVVPFNFVFKGPSGCGKTTAARKIGRVFHHTGLLATCEVVEASAKDMIAEYVGQTVNKTRRLLESALGKVLFIDEAYRLTGGSSFVREARDELVDAMTKPKFLGKMAIILAGYESNMDAMLSANPGLASRFETTIRFKNLSSEGCVTLLRKRLEESRVKVMLGEEEGMIRDIFDSLRTMKDWGNGRDIESIARRAIGQAFESPVNNEPPQVDGKVILDVIRKWSDQRYPLLLSQTDNIQESIQDIVDAAPEDDSFEADL